MEVRFFCTGCQREFTRTRTDPRGKLPTVCLECQHENRHIYRKARIKSGACRWCGTHILMAESGARRQYCDRCYRQRKTAADAARFQRPEVKEKARLASRRYHAKNKEAIAIKRKERHYREKLRAAASDESKATGVPIEKILQRWGM